MYYTTPDRHGYKVQLYWHAEAYNSEAAIVGIFLFLF